MLSAADIIRLLDLKPHPEGGHFHQTFRDARTIDGGRAASTAIYFLLARGERSHWHRVDAVEVWHYAGAPLCLEIAQADATERITLGANLCVAAVQAGRAGAPCGGAGLATGPVSCTWRRASVHRLRVGPPGWTPGPGGAAPIRKHFFQCRDDRQQLSATLA
jgi:hypothetical protein